MSLKNKPCGTGLLAADASATAASGGSTGGNIGNCEAAFARLQQRMSQHDVSGYVVQVVLHCHFFVAIKTKEWKK